MQIRNLRAQGSDDQSAARPPTSSKVSNQWCSEVRAWPGTCSTKVRPAHVCTSTSVVSTMVKRTAGARPIPMTWLFHCF